MSGSPHRACVAKEADELQFFQLHTDRLSDGRALVDATVAGLGLVQFPILLLRKKLAAGSLELMLSDESDAGVKGMQPGP